MFQNVDGKSFVDVSKQMGPDFLYSGYKRGSAFADFNNDGFVDIVVTALHRKPRILMNSGEGGNWLLIEATGQQSSRDAIGARIKVTTASGRTLHNHITTSVGFLSSSDRRVHFGLGTELSATSVEIVWPSGKTDSFRNVAANQILRINERAQEQN